MPKNQQTSVAPNYEKTGELAVHSVWKTIQGEGPFSGMVAIFVRLWGCNLKCPACDTDYTSKKGLFSPDGLLKEIQTIDNKPGLVVLTGGEPLIQNVIPFIGLLLRRDYQVQVETNGTFVPDRPFPHFNNLSVVCSPKMSYCDVPHRIITAWKYIIEAGYVDSDDGLPTRVLGMNVRPYRPRFNDPQVEHAPVFVQPQDDNDPDKDRANLEEAKRSCLKYGYRLSLQIHKIIGME